MRKILFVVNSLNIGGSEKSLISLLNNMDYSKYEIDLLIFTRGGDFEKYIPKEVNILESPEYYKFLLTDKKYSIVNKIRFLYYRMKTSIKLRINLNKKNRIQSEQVLYKSQKKVLEEVDKGYDVAIAYSQGMPTYFIADKVKADKKIAWINCDYKMTGYNKEIDYEFYKKIDKMIAVSQYGKKSIISVNKNYEYKTEIILDIVDPTLIEKMSDENIVFEDKSNINICTVARLITHYKGYDMAIKAAKLLKDDGYKFKWYAVGEGEDRNKLEEMIHELGLQEEFILLGKKINPYPYMKNCDIYVQPSRNEGFGLTVIEAKILKKPIVCTNFNTSKEIINNGINGLIVDMSEQEIYKGIKSYIDDKNLMKKVQINLNNEESYNSIEEIEKIYSIID